MTKVRRGTCRGTCHYHYALAVTHTPEIPAHRFRQFGRREALRTLLLGTAALTAAACTGDNPAPSAPEPHARWGCAHPTVTPAPGSTNSPSRG
ncbi:hypothetical protein GORHZ_244_00020 [Gordonia rhizosphera NBRC 16068]|uniref:Uncharacterized protein n=1 Tax=Gordonia rhizosphera NBRC 16068 TaxID=1108045 RepID=K6W3L3_9ACTN|nr:hypothetical protein GORHZ_244_00020 [Gordonia rhizosphera NBRC 16068]